MHANHPLLVLYCGDNVHFMSEMQCCRVRLVVTIMQSVVYKDLSSKQGRMQGGGQI